ncbi:hypothetical protein M427DRAFT_68571 [Gonapodya prolifera JEL478]|uniref:DUF3533 domain-containing protein n=1 Tax=Gonapodya prolifera (strain JEL478) TaxID=1344416 RepID=A0A139AK41_GONPJ|nr:hypothetical protein M427DRAFT_68571 [Gonapodya prolifera JEL478]|eukprot:KXS17140.1 hypothetical protein M427DRAFT_68571 [Gonapodya prolifera JEL478]
MADSHRLRNLDGQPQREADPEGLYLEITDEEMLEVGPPPIIAAHHHWGKFLAQVIANGLAVTALAATFIWLYVGSAWNIDTTQITYGVAIAPQLDYSIFPESVQGAVPPPASLINSTFLQPLAGFMTGRFGLQYLDDVTTRDVALTTADRGERVWSVIWIDETYSRNLVAGLLGVNGSQPASIELMHDSAKHFTSETSFYQAFLAFFRSYRASVGVSLAAQAAQLTGKPPVASTFWIQGPVNLINNDLHPVNKSAQNLHSFIAFVVLYVAAILTITMTSRIHDPHHPIRQGVGRLVSAFLYMVAQVTVVAIVPWCLPDVQGSLLAAWAWWLLVGMQQLAFVSMFYMLLGRMMGQALATFFLYLSLCTSSSIIVITISHPFFRLGYGLASYYAVHGARAIYFGSQWHLLLRDALAVTGWLVGCLLVVIVGYAWGLNVKVGRKVYEKTRSKIHVPPSRAPLLGNDGKPGKMTER